MRNNIIDLEIAALKLAATKIKSISKKISKGTQEFKEKFKDDDHSKVIIYISSDDNENK